MAKAYGADHAVLTLGKSASDVGIELQEATGQKDLDGIFDCVGAPETIQLGAGLLSISRYYVDVGLLVDRIDIPLFPRINRERSFYGSNWGNYVDLSEVMALAAKGKIQHAVKRVGFDQINESIERLREGKVIGRLVMTF